MDEFRLISVRLPGNPLVAAECASPVEHFELALQRLSPARISGFIIFFGHS